MDRIPEKGRLIAKKADRHKQQHDGNDVGANRPERFPQQHGEPNAGFGSDPTQKAAQNGQNRRATESCQKGFGQRHASHHAGADIDAGKCDDLSHQSGDHSVVAPAILLGDRCR